MVDGKQPPRNAPKPVATTTDVGSSNAPALHKGVAVAKALFLVATMGLTNYASQLALHPLYGGTTTSAYFPHVVAGSMVFAMLIPVGPAAEGYLFHILSTFLCLAPYSAYTFGAWTARWEDQKWGPIAAQLPLAIPVLVLGSWLLRIHMFSVIGVSQEFRLYRSGFFVTAYAWVNMTSNLIDQKLPEAIRTSSCNIFLGLGVASLLVSAANSLLLQPASVAPKGSSPKTKTSSGLSYVKLSLTVLSIAFLATSKTNRPCNSPSFPLMVNKDGHPIRIIASKSSLTGQIVVGEALDVGFRFMRCDHSLLGGVWLGEDKISTLSSGPGHVVPAGGTDVKGERLGDSIYAAFMLQDAMRLFKKAEASQSKQSALIIGLGIGVMPRSLALQGITPTIVEIDPVVHEFATEYFGLTSSPPPPNETSTKLQYFVSPDVAQTHYQDARQYVQNRASIIQGMRPIRESDRYDYVVHDVFSGGSVPTHLFTAEFWEEIKVVLKLDGILAVNFAGRIKSDASRAILTTLEKSFAKCRIYRDHRPETEAEEAQADHDFNNMVFFCAQSPNIHLVPRAPVPADYLDSRLRRHVFDGFRSLEIPRSRILGQDNVDAEEDSEYVLRDDRNKLGMWQESTALEHWRLMRKVMPDAVWEAY